MPPKYCSTTAKHTSSPLMFTHSAHVIKHVHTSKYLQVHTLKLYPGCATFCWAEGTLMSLPALIHQPWSQRMLPSHRQTNCTERSWRQRRRFVVPRASMKSTADGNVFTWGGGVQLRVGVTSVSYLLSLCRIAEPSPRRDS